MDGVELTSENLASAYCETPRGERLPLRSRGLCGMPAACLSMNFLKKVSSTCSGITYGGPCISPFCMRSSR